MKDWKRLFLGALARCVGILLVLAASPTRAQGLGPDVAGGTDHPLVSRFAGSQLVGFEQQGFGQARFLPPGKDPKKDLAEDKPVIAEGKLTRLLYLAPVGRSPLEVHRNFEQALRQAGLQTRTAADGTGAWWGPGDVARRTGFDALTFLRPWAPGISPMARDDGYYFYGTLQRGGVTVSVSVLTGPASRMARDEHKVTAGVPFSVVAMQIVEPVAMETGAVTVNAAAIQQGLIAEGKVTLHGLQFDTGRATLKPESRPQLQQMAAWLLAHPTLLGHVVGHTDNVGSLAANMALSQQRAQAVVQALVSEHRVSPQRLVAHGVASLAPVASNSDEAGRAKNRRVELVLQ
jgi:outer membrane protein OmpA-like peptidoglycan-associated protein